MKSINSETEDLLRNAPGLFSADEYEEIVEKIPETIHYIETLENPRTLIIESWLVIDWFIRNILCAGLGLAVHSQANFDVRYKILPSSFSGCSKVLMEFIELQKKLKQRPPNARGHIRYSLGILKFLREEYPTLLDQIERAEQEFSKKVLKIRPLQLSAIEIYSSASKAYRSVPNDWIDSVERLDEDWFKNANKLNEARNYAAHSFSANEIYRILGINGKNRDKHVQFFCLNMLKNLVGVDPKLGVNR